MTAAYSGMGASAVSRKWGRQRPPAQTPYERLFRGGVVAVLAVVVLAPVLLIGYQSLLDNAFFHRDAHLSLAAYGFVLSDSDFFSALGTTVVFTSGMVLIAVPLGATLAFLTTRSDVRFKRVLEILILMPMFLSSLILAFGYVVTIGPQGFLTIAWRSAFGTELWNIYSLAGMTIVAGLSHVPHVYLYVSAAMRNLPSELEEAARTCGAGPWRIFLDVTLPLVAPALVFAVMLNVLLGFEVFGIPLILGEPRGITVLTTYIHKLSTMMGAPSYELMAVVSVCLLVMTLPMVWLQRRLLGRSRRFAVVGGKGARSGNIRLGMKGQVVAMIIIGAWLLVSVFLPISGIVVRAFVSAWGAGTDLWQQLSLQSFREVLAMPALVRSIGNTALLSIVGGAIAVGVYLLIGLASHRNQGRSTVMLDYLVLLPRALPGIVVGLAFLWLFLFVPFLTPIRGTLLCLLLAYMVVGLSYGLRIIQSALLQVSPELEEAARVAGATASRAWRDILVPVIRPGLMGAFVLIMIVFIRENSTGLYLMGSGTEVVGSLIITLTQSGDLNPGAVLALLNILMIAAALAFALGLGVRIRD